MTIRIEALLALVLLVSACDESTTGEDAGAQTDAGMMMTDDAGMAADDAGMMMDDDAGMMAVDAGPDDGCGGACTGDLECFRGVCIDPCGADISGWDAALEAGITPVENVCRPATARAIVGDADPVVYELSQRTEDGVTFLELARWPLADAAAAESVASVRVEEPTDGAPWGDATPFAGSYLALSATHALIGYTVFNEGAAPGEVFIVELATGSAVAVNAPGNSDAAWIGEDLVINGLALGDVDNGQGLYFYNVAESRVVHVGTGLRDLSGGLIVTSDYVVAGGSSGEPAFEPITLVAARSALDTAITSGSPVDFGAVGTAPSLDIGPSAFFAPSADLIGTAEFFGAGTRIWTRTYSADTLTLTDERVISNDSMLFSTVYVTSDRILVGHGSGVLIGSDS